MKTGHWMFKGGHCLALEVRYINAWSCKSFDRNFKVVMTMQNFVNLHKIKICTKLNKQWYTLIHTLILNLHINSKYVYSRTISNVSSPFYCVNIREYIFFRKCRTPLFQQEHFCFFISVLSYWTRFVVITSVLQRYRKQYEKEINDYDKLRFCIEKSWVDYCWYSKWHLLNAFA